MKFLENLLSKLDESSIQSNFLFLAKLRISFLSVSNKGLISLNLLSSLIFGMPIKPFILVPRNNLNKTVSS